MKGIKSARGIFAKSRKSPHLTWHTFEASAMMEYHGNKDATVATKIFAIASQRFPSEVDFLIRHIQFLLSINDDTSKRSQPSQCMRHQLMVRCSRSVRKGHLEHSRRQGSPSVGHLGEIRIHAR